MADDDWKKRVGIEINFSPDSLEKNSHFEFINGVKEEDLVENTESSFDSLTLDNDDIFTYDEFGTTPPRTRISKRQKERRQREKELYDSRQSPKVIQANHRRNTIDSLYFCELLERSDNKQNQDHEQTRPEARRVEKRSRKLLRGSERDMKLDLSDVSYHTSVPNNESDERSESMPDIAPHPTVKVETDTRFNSLLSKPVFCASKLKHKALCNRTKDCPQDRVDFYSSFSLLIKIGSNEKPVDKNPRRHLSREEDLWQNELKDLIWLELQAWHADRTPTEQDDFLCGARVKVEELLNEIMHYRFNKCSSSLDIISTKSLSAQSSDSGISSTSGISTEKNSVEECDETHNTDLFGPRKLKHRNKKSKCPCEGCLSMYCMTCLETQNVALKEIESLLKRLEAAEGLYPSSKAFGIYYPLYASVEFTGRVKAMCLWYNMTKLHRLRLLIIGKLFTNLQSKSCHWPNIEDDDANSSGIATDEDHYIDTHSISRSTSVEGKPFNKSRYQKVHFEFDYSSPSDSNNSNISSNSNSSVDARIDHIEDLFNMVPISRLHDSLFPSESNSLLKYPYRRYMDQVLKTRGLSKSLNFLERLHRNVLFRAMITLEKPKESEPCVCNLDSEQTEKQSITSDDTLISHIEADKLITDYPSKPLVKNEDEEDLRKYGYWSTESRSLNLPSYRSSYLFLARVPFELVLEFIRMRLEQKPDQPSVLSIRQLMREFKEALHVAIVHKQRYVKLVESVLWNVDPKVIDEFKDSITEFDKNLRNMLDVYLDYLEKWIKMVPHEISQKNLLEEEWSAMKELCKHIPYGEGAAADKFCRMAIGMLQGISRYLTSRVKELTNVKASNECPDEEESSRKQVMFYVCREFQTLFNAVREKALKSVAFSKTLKKDLDSGIMTKNLKAECSIVIAASLEQLKTEALHLRKDIALNIKNVEKTCEIHDMESELDDVETGALLNRCREVLHAGYKFGFEYHKEVCRLITGKARCRLSRGMIDFAQQWMLFVKERCERGRGRRPRWANHGLDFLITVLEPENTAYLTDQEFEKLKTNIDQCVSHVIGTAVPSSHSPTIHSHIHPRSRGTSPSPSTRKAYRASRSLQEGLGSTPPVSAARSWSTQTSIRTPESLVHSNSEEHVDGILAESLTVPSQGLSRIERVQVAIERLENEVEKNLRDQNLIGTVTSVQAENIPIRPRGVTFSWQRGIKIGQGRFGKVYTAVNNQTGELMAVKEIQLQPNDHKTIRRVTEELRIFEGIQHNHLIRYYGVEIHREEMLIFMEFCAEGTLESLVAATECGLPEALIRRYTLQLLLAVSTLHNHGIVHRDIKSANIFLTDEGNCLKLGDFGSAVKIKAHTTMPGELQGFVGTQAYMAPEVFMKTNTDGHGRAADVWSIGCVVVEMSSGKRPWAEFDSNYQIMFKVGMGESPAVPLSLSEEGHEFLELCLQHDPRQRATATDLLHHNFVKVEEDEELVLPSIFQDFFKSTKK